MNENEKITFLNDYTMTNSSVRIVHDSDEINKSNIPLHWKQAFSVHDTETRKEVIFNEWKKYVALELSNTIMYLETYTTNIDLMCIDGRYSILYTILNRSQTPMYYEGKNPLETISCVIEALKSQWNLVDESIVGFYTCVHDGFYDFTSKSMGLDNATNIEKIADYDWEYENQIDFDISNLFNFFSSGMGTYIALDVTSNTKTGAYLWSSKKLPLKNLDFWDVVDEWIVIGFE